MPSTRKKINKSPTKTSKKIKDTKSDKSSKRKLSEVDKEGDSTPKSKKGKILIQHKDNSDTDSVDSSEIEEVEVTKNNTDHNYSAVLTLDTFPPKDDGGYEPLPMPDIKPKIIKKTPTLPNLLKKTVSPNLLKKTVPPNLLEKAVTPKLLEKPVPPKLLEKAVPPKVVLQHVNPVQQRQLQIQQQHQKQFLHQKQIEAQLQQQLQQKRKEILLQKQKKMIEQERLKEKIQHASDMEDLIMVDTDKGVMFVPKNAMNKAKNLVGTNPSLQTPSKQIITNPPLIDLTSPTSLPSKYLNIPPSKKIAPLIDLTGKTPSVDLLPSKSLNNPPKTTPPLIDLTEKTSTTPKVAHPQYNLNKPSQKNTTIDLSEKMSTPNVDLNNPTNTNPALIDLTENSTSMETAPKNLKIDFVNGTIVVEKDIFKIECFDTQCPDGKVRVTVAANNSHPKRTIVLKKLPPQLSQLLTERWNTSRNEPKTAKPNEPKTAKPNEPKTPFKSNEPKKHVTILPNVSKNQDFERHVPETSVDGKVNCIVVGGKKYEYVPSNPIKTPPKAPKIDKDLINTQLVLDELSKALDADDKDSETSSISIQSAKKFFSPKSKSGIRWSEDDKLTALSLYKYSPKRYKTLQTIFSLPSKKLLTLIFRSVKLSEGINQKLFMILKYSLKHFNEKDKICSLSFDVVIQTRPNKVTEYALIFVLNGLNKSWEQPIANYVDIKHFQPKLISERVTEIISAVESIGLTVICTVCNVKLFQVLKCLGSTVKNPTFVLNGKTRYTLLDFKDLLINVRNELYNHDIKIGSDIENDVARWRHIKEVILFDNINTYRHIQGIDDSYLEVFDKNSKNKFIKSRKILSYKIGSSLNSFTVSKNLESSGIATANFVIKMNELFDSFLGNSDIQRGLKGLNCILNKTRENIHLDYWSASIEEISKWKFLNNNKTFNSRVLSSILIVLKVLPLLWNDLKNYGFDNFNLNKLSTKSLNNYVQRARVRNAKLKREMSLFSILTLELKHKTESNVVDMMIKQDNQHQLSPDEQMFKILTQFVSSPSFYQNIMTAGPVTGAEDSSDSSDSDA